MASILKGKIRVSPSGLFSVMVSHVPVGASMGKMVISGAESPFLDFESGGLRVMSGAVDSAPSLPPPLAVVPNFGKKRTTPRPEFDVLPSGYGSLGKKEKASWKSCRGVRERMSSSEIEYGVKNCALLTVTLPSVDDLAYEALARYSSYAIDRLNREFKRFFSGREFARISVWEYQKRGALHCHILLASDCIHAMRNSDIADYFSGVWYRTLLAIEKRFPCNMFLKSNGGRWGLGELKKVVNNKKESVFVNVQKVRKSVVAYLSKYLADSNHENKATTKQGLRSRFYPIATWFQWNRHATMLAKKYTEEFDFGYAEPDRKKEVRSVLDKMKKEICSEVVLASGTTIKEPRNPYNMGLYWLPSSHLGLESSSKIVVHYMERLAGIFKPKESPYEMRQVPIYEKEEEEDVEIYRGMDEFMGKYYLRDEFMEQSKDWGEFMAGFLMKMLDFSEDIEYKIGIDKSIIYQQIEIDFHAEKTI